jgi:hypothetical protein
VSALARTRGGVARWNRTFRDYDLGRMEESWRKTVVLTSIVLAFGFAALAAAGYGLYILIHFIWALLHMEG